MPRPKKPKGSPIIYPSFFKLSEKDKERLIVDILGIDTDSKKGKKTAKQVLTNIEFFIGAYFEFLKNSPPTEAAILNEILSIRETAKKLMHEVSDMSGWALHRLKDIGYDKLELTKSLATFINTASKNIPRNKIESRGQPPKRALQILVNHLYLQFKKSYVALEDYADDDPNGTKAKTAKNEALNSFITECLDIAEIKYPKDITTLFYTDNTPESERFFFQQFL